MDTTPFIDENLIAQIAPVFDKDYTTDALSFISNHHRILNYWAEGVDILPPQLGESKRRKFSLFDLVWLGIVKELRDFGMEKEKIAVLKGELLSPPDHKAIIRNLKTTRKEVEAILAKNFGVGTDTIKPVLDEYLSRQLEIQSLSLSWLSIYLYYAMARKTDINILVTKGGHHKFDSPDFMQAKNTGEVLPALTESYISISLNEILYFFIALPFVKDTVKQNLLSDKEWTLIELVRSPSLSSVKVYFDKDSDLKKVELTKKRKVNVEARLTEILLKGKYERIEIETQNGKPVHYTSTEKVSL